MTSYKHIFSIFSLKGLKVDEDDFYSSLWNNKWTFYLMSGTWHEVSSPDHYNHYIYIYIYMKSQGSSVSIETRLRAYGLGFTSR